MNTIKKTTLIAVITAMAAIAVPSMASAATWKPINTNKTLTATNLDYIGKLQPDYSFKCSNVSLGAHVRTPASSTLDITSASFTGCTSYFAPWCGAVTVTATGLPWTVTTSGSNVSMTEHLQVFYPCQGGFTLNLDGPVTGSYNNTTHTATTVTTHPMQWTYMGTWADYVSENTTHAFHETTNTLVLT
jgi:hypothetical protein